MEHDLIFVLVLSFTLARLAASRATLAFVQDRYRARLIESVVICLPSQKLAYGSLAEKRSRQANDSVSVVATCV